MSDFKVWPTGTFFGDFPDEKDFSAIEEVSTLSRLAFLGPVTLYPGEFFCAAASEKTREVFVFLKAPDCVHVYQHGFGDGYEEFVWFGAIEEVPLPVTEIEKRKLIQHFGFFAVAEE